MEVELSQRDLFMNLSISQLVQAMARGEASAVNIAGACIAQVEQLEARYRAWVFFDAGKLMAEASAADERLRCGGAIRRLEGIPFGVKDVFNTADFPTEMGSPIWAGFTPGNDARVVFNLKQAGALVPGKTVTAEFAVHTLGKTLNPHDVTRTPGTSSSGSAVAVALGMVPAALGTQTAGSIVRPASFCGVYGCKPSFGLIPRTGVLKTTDSLDTVGYFATHLADLERVFELVRVHGCDYPISHSALQDPGRQTKPDDRPWRVALARTHVWSEAHEYARDALLDWSRQLGAVDDIEVAEAELPEGMESAHEIHSTIYDRTLAYYFKKEFKKHELVSPIMYELIVHGQQINLSQYAGALRAQERLAAEMDEFFGGYDALVSLSTVGEAPFREERERNDPALMWTMTHLPVISAPAFISPSGLPFGLQLVARRYNDRLLFEFARYLRSLDLIPAGPNPRLAL